LAMSKLFNNETLAEQVFKKKKDNLQYMLLKSYACQWQILDWWKGRIAFTNDIIPYAGQPKGLA